MYSSKGSFRYGMPDSLKWQNATGAILPFDLADMDLPTAPEILSDIVKRAEYGQFGYAKPPQDLPPLISERLRSLYEWKISPSELVWLPGTVSGLRAAILTACEEEGDEVITFTPAYEPFLTLPEALHRKLKSVKLQESNWRIDFDALEDVITPRTKLLLLCHPHNPTGAMWSRADVRKLTDICRRHNIIICSDEVHAELILDQARQHTPVAVIDSEVTVITLMSASKTFNLAGLGCGFAVISDSSLRERFVQIRQKYIPAVTTFGYAGTLAAFSKGDKWKASLLNHLRKNQSIVHTFCIEHGLPIYQAPATYLAWIDVRKLQIPNIQQHCTKYGIRIYSGETFGCPGFIRLTFACSQDQLTQGLERLRNALVLRGRFQYEIM